MKNKLKRLIACLLALMLMSSDIAVLAEEVIKTLTLPAALQIIEEGAFYGNTSIDKVVVPDGTTEIRSKAFANSSLIELVLPDTLTFIADDAFDGCSEFEVSVPENCYAYDWAVRMGYINEENATPAECFTTEALSDGTLAIKSYIGSYTDVVIPSVIDGVQVTEIGNEAFKDCKELTSVLIPEGVVSIGDRVFKYCSILKNVDFPNTLRYVGEDVFGYCYELTSADFTDTKLTSLGDSLFTFCESLVDVKFPKTLEKIDMHAFHACDGLISLDLSETALISIETNAFWSCDGLHTVVLPATLKSIKSFGYCANLTNINLEETSLEIIGTNAFVGCEKLAEIVLPATVKRIEKTAFGNCSGLVTINLPAELEFIADDAFADCNTFTIVAEEGTYAYDWAVRMGYISEQTQGPKIVATGSCGATLTWTVYDDGKMTISGSGAMDNYTSASAPWNQHKAIIESLVIEEGVTSIGNYAFLRLTNLKTAEIHDDVTEIGTCAFGACEALQHVKLPNRIAQINNYTFDGCGGLTEIVIPDSVTYIGAGAFTGCSSLNGIILPDGVTGIGAYAFHNCKELTEITIPDNVTEIANDVFSGECGITTITFSGKNVSSIGKRAIPSTAVVICYKDSVVENWAITNGNTVEYIKEISATPSEYFVTGELDDGTLAITGYIGEDTDIIIPATINGVQVTEIAAYAFQSQSITSVVLPDTVTSIGEYAFAYCESLESIIIPEGVETIHDYTFNACSSLASVDLPNSVTSIGEYAFQRCVKLTDFNWPSSLETIGQYAFRKCDAFVNVVLPASVKHIELGAFEWCANLESIVLPETLERLDGYVFYDCSKLTKINLPESINAIGNYTFYRCTALTSFELPETVTSIGSGAFMSCSALTDIYLHHNISSIIHSAFSYCDNLTAKVDVGSYAYSWCKTYDVRFQLSTATSAEYFKTDTLADGTLSITEYVGDEVDVVIPSMIDGVKVTEVGDKAFYEKQLESVVIPEGVTRIGQSAFQYIYELKEIQLPSTLKVVDDFAFFCCDLSELNLPEGLTTIGAYGFGLNRMITVEIPSSVTSIANKAFHQTENLTEYTVSEGNNAYKAIDGALFTIDGATLIAYPAGSEETEYTVPDGVREIADYAFNYASKLTGITLPDSLERIGYHAFEHCTSLQSIRLPSSCTMIDSGAFYNCSSMSKINIPYGVEEIKDSTFGLCSQLTSVELPDSVTEILCVAFGECHGLESIYIPESVTYIDTQAFNNCPLLQVSVVEGSYAHTWCERKGISFSLIGGASVLQAPILEISEKSYQSVTLTWEDVEGAEAYDIYCASAEAGAYAYVGTTEESQFIHNNLTCSTTYYYRVCAMSETLTSEYSNVIGVTTEDQIISLSVPENVVVTVISEEALRISWNAIEGAEGYYVMFDGSVIAEITGVNNCNFKQEELQADTEYRIGVKAYSHKNNGDEVVGAESTPIIGRTAAELSVEAVVVDRSLMLNEAITVNTEVAGNYGDFIYRYTIRKDGEIVAASGECDDAQYSYTPTTFGTYSVIVVVMDLLGRTSGCQIDGIMVKATDLEISNVAINKSIVMLGESVTITADSNRENGLTYSANVYCGDVKADSIIGVEKLTFAPDAVGVYSFAVEITDEYGETEYVYLKNILNVVPYWNLLSVTPDATQINVGTTVSFAVSTEGEVSDVTFSYTIYKDNAIYMESGDKEQSTYSISLSEVGVYKCVCVATDKYNHTMTATSNNVKVVRKNVVNDIFTTATHGNTLDLDLLDGMDSDEVRVAQGAVTVTWDKLSTDAYYRLSIECNTTNQEIVYNTKYTSNSYTIASSSIKAGYEYYVSVYRYNSSGTRTARLSFDFVVIGGSSLLLEADPKIVVPTKYASVNHDDLTIQWTKMNYASTIDIILEYNCGVDDHEILRETVSGATSTYTIPKEILQNGTEHYLRIVARDSLGNSKNASCYFYVGCSEDNLLEITEPVLNNSYMSDGYYRDKVPTYPAYEPILISWNFNPNVAFYSLHLEDYDNEKKETVYSNIRTNSYTVQPTVLVSGHRYSVEVYAHHTDTCYEVSEDMWFRAPYKGNLLLDPPKVISPELSLVEDDPTVFVLQDLTIAWEPVTAATTYDVEMRFQDEANSVDFEATGLKKPIVTIPKEDIWTDELNSIVITAYDASGNYTYEKYYIKAVDSTIVAPTLLSPALSADKTDIPAYAEKDMTLIWGAVEGAVEYRVQVRDYYAEEWDLIIDAQGVTDERYTIPADELYLGGRFRVRIKAIDQYGNGEYSDTYYFQIGSSKYMNLTVSDWTFDYEGGSKNTHLHTSQQWEADVSDSWISVSRSSGDASMQLTITVDENDDDFPRSGNVTFVNEAGGCVVFSVVQEGNGSANTGALKITNPDQGETLDYAGFRTNWSYNYDHAYFNVKLYDVTSRKTVYDEDQIITYYEDIPQSALTYGHIYQLTVEVYNAQYNKISESSIVFKVESLNGGSGDGTGTDDDVIDDTDAPEGVNEIIYAGITDGAEISLDDISVSWQNVIGADHYWVALRDMTLYPEGTAEADVIKIIDQETELLTVNILEGQLTEGHSYRLWIAAHKTGVDTPISGKNIYFTVKNSTDDGDTPEGTDTLIPTATLSAGTEQVVLGNQIALSGKVLANGGILNQIRVTVQDAQTGKFCDYAIYDLAAIEAFGYFDQFDLANVYPIVTGEGTHIGTSGSGYAREGSASLYLDTAGDKYQIVVYGKNNGDEEMHVLASTIVTLIGEDNEATGGSVTWNDHTYHLIDESMTWTEAKAYCESLGGYLVTITSAEEQQVIEGLLASSGTKNLYWIGLDENLESCWITGEVSDYTNWCAGEPNGSGEKYGEIYRDSAWSPAYTWNDSANAAGGSSYHALSNHGLICEFGDVVVAPKEYNFTLNSTAEELTVSVGDTITFAGEIRAGSAQLVNVQASLLDADDPTKGVRFDRFEDINADTFDLSDFKSIVAGETYSDESQSITVEAGKSYIVMLHVADANGVGFTDRDPNTEGPQGPSILVHVEEAEDSGLWNGHTYKVIDQSMTWTEAKAYCESLGGYLATITSAEEQEAVAEVLSRYGSKNVYWIGLYEKGEDSGWVTGEAYSYSNWSSGEPNDNDEVELYTEMYRTSTWHGNAYEWNDSSNTANSQDFYSISNHGLICEFGDVNVTSAGIETKQVRQSGVLSSQVTVTGLLIMPDGYVVDDFKYVGIQYALAESYDAATDTGWKETLFAYVSADGSIELTIKQLKPETEYVFRAVAYDEKQQKWLCGNAIFHQMPARAAYEELFADESGPIIIASIGGFLPSTPRVLDPVEITYPANGDMLNTTDIVLKWKPVDNAERYYIYVRDITAGEEESKDDKYLLTPVGGVEMAFSDNAEDYAVRLIYMLDDNKQFEYGHTYNIAIKAEAALYESSWGVTKIVVDLEDKPEADVTVSELAELTIEMLFYNETDNRMGLVNKNDEGAVSLGMFQWRGNRALNLLRAICTCALTTKDEVVGIIGNTLYVEIMNDETNWSSRVLTEDEASVVKKLLVTDAGINEQTYLAHVDAESYINAGKGKGFTDPAALLVYADIVNLSGVAVRNRVATDAIELAGGTATSVTAQDIFDVYRTDIVLRDSMYDTRRAKVKSFINSLYAGEITGDTWGYVPDDDEEPATDFSPIWPLKSNYQVSAIYYYYLGGNPDYHQCYMTGNTTRYTAGIDVSVASGNEVMAVADGTVVRSEDVTTSGFRNLIVIDHGNGIYSMYAHLSERLVEVGTVENPTIVKKGEIIAKSGKDSDDKIGHLHFEIFEGTGPKTVTGGNAWLNYYRKKYMTSLKYEESVYLANNLKKDSDSLSKAVVDWLDTYYTKENGVYEYDSNSDLGNDTSTCTLDVAPTQWQLGSYAASKDFTVTYDSAWSINRLEEGENKLTDWLSFDISSTAGVLTLKATENGGVQRDFDVVLTCNEHNISKIIRVVQNEKGVIDSKRQAVIDYAMDIYEYTWNTDGYVLLYSSEYNPSLNSDKSLNFVGTPVVATGQVRGIPYSLSANGVGVGKGEEKTFSGYKGLSSEQRLKISSVYTYGGGNRVSMHYGMSCATFVTDCILKGLTGKGLSVNSLSYFYEIGKWSDYITKGTKDAEGYRKLQPGDYLWVKTEKRRHVMLVYANDGESITVIEQTPPDNTRRNCTNPKTVSVSLTSIEGVTKTYNAIQVCMNCDACKKSTLGTQKTAYTYSKLSSDGYYPMYVDYD